VGYSGHQKSHTKKEPIEVEEEPVVENDNANNAFEEVGEDPLALPNEISFSAPAVVPIPPVKKRSGRRCPICDFAINGSTNYKKHMRVRSE
jgi:hypothetical protein